MSEEKKSLLEAVKKMQAILEAAKKLRLGETEKEETIEKAEKG